MRINVKSIYNKVFTRAKNKILKTMNNKVLRVFTLEKNKLIENIVNHQVSKEIKSGPFGSPSSGAVSGGGNLFSFLGFNEGSDPITELESFLQERIQIKLASTLFKNGKAKVSILVPSKKDFNLNLSLSWDSGRSWPHAIEEGLSNLGYFLSISGGRSSGGIQVNSQVKNVQFSHQPYISKEIENFKERMHLIK